MINDKELKKKAEEAFPFVGLTQDQIIFISACRKGYKRGFQEAHDELAGEIDYISKQRDSWINEYQYNADQITEINEELTELQCNYNDLNEDYSNLEDNYKTLKAKLNEIKEENKKLQCIIDSQAIAKLKSDKNADECVTTTNPFNELEDFIIKWNYINNTTSFIKKVPNPGVNVRLAFESVKTKGKIDYTTAYIDEFGIWHHYKENWTYSKPIAWCILPTLLKV